MQLVDTKTIIANERKRELWYLLAKMQAKGESETIWKSDKKRKTLNSKSHLGLLIKDLYLFTNKNTLLFPAKKPLTPGRWGILKPNKAAQAIIQLPSWTRMKIGSPRQP